MKAFITTYFNYCSIVWMFCSRKINNLTNNVHKRALRVAYNEYDSSFQAVLSKDHAKQYINNTCIDQHSKCIKRRLTKIQIFRISFSDFINRHMTSEMKHFLLENQTQLFMELEQSLTDVVRFGIMQLPAEVRNPNKLIKQITISCYCKLCTQQLHNKPGIYHID